MQTEIQQARELIRQKRYQEARNILVMVDHPKAEEWIARIDKIFEDRWGEYKSAPPQKEQAKPRRLRGSARTIAIVVFVAFLAFAVWFVIELNEQEAIGHIWSRLQSWCRDVNGYGHFDYCWRFGEIWKDSRAVQACNRAFPDLDRPFRECAYGEGIAPTRF